jgi:hypothetical protein
LYFRGARPAPEARGDTLVIYKPDRVAWSMKELLGLLGDDLYAKGLNLDSLCGISLR